jgi:hypothetical protein
MDRGMEGWREGLGRWVRVGSEEVEVIEERGGGLGVLGREHG